MEKQIEFLKEVGLTKTEATAYLTLLGLGEALAGKIASEAKSYRKNIYDALDSLLQKGLVTYAIRRGKKHWKCVSPEKIRSLLEEKISKADLFLPQLLNKYKQKKIDRSIEMFEGKGGMKSFYNFVLNLGKNYQIIGASGELFEKLKYYAPNYVKELLKKDIHVKLLCYWNAKNIKEMKKLNTVELKVLPKTFKSPTQIMLFDIYSAIIIWSDEPIAILIKSKQIQEGFKEYFEFLWNISKP